ncbi:MAG: hypothetical protein FJY85_12525, partial [Deltaproteobacteria bacterium]|nr:hypothetical protein [Deltaproteobacteria bacterium]
DPAVDMNNVRFLEQPRVNEEFEVDPEESVKIHRHIRSGHRIAAVGHYSSLLTNLSLRSAQVIGDIGDVVHVEYLHIVFIPMIV